MFAVPRPKKNLLIPPNKKRKTAYNIEEISFDNSARQEYLTGFHKRKQARIKLAQEEAEKRAREEKLAARKQLREERRRDAEAHVQNVNKILRESDAAFNIEGEEQDEDSDDWEGFPDNPDLEILDHEEEYIDEDRYTTVTVESVAVSRDGLEKPRMAENSDENEAENKNPDDEDTQNAKDASKRPTKKKKKKFRYETKIERQLEQNKQRSKRSRK